jgi:acetyl-CoA C-acetyltransferase
MGRSAGQQRFSAAQKAGRFVEEIVAIDISGRKGAQRFDTDEANRPDSTMEILAKLKPAFRKDGTITAGNAPGLNSGAAAMLVAERRTLDAQRLNPIARLVGYGIAAVEPGMFGIGPVPAAAGARSRPMERGRRRRASRSTRRSRRCCLAVLRELWTARGHRVNVEGGAIATAIRSAPPVPC